MTEELEHKVAMSEVDARFNKRRMDLIEGKKRKKKNDRLAASLSLTIADIAYALHKHRGNIHYAAEFLGVDRPVLYRKIQNTPSLKRLQYEIKQQYLDIAEGKLLDQVEDGILPAIAFYLKTQGKDRGYTERGTIEHEMGENMAKNAAALIEAMKRGAETANELEEYTWVEVPTPLLPES